MGSYRGWLATLLDTRRAATSPAMWMVTGLIILGILLLTAFVQPVASWFRLDFWPALFCFLPSLILGLVVGHFEHQGRVSLPTYGALILLGNSLFQFFFGSLVALSQAPGSFALASLLVLTLTVHGYMARASLTYPYPAFGSVVAMVAAACLRPDAETLSIFAFVGPTGLFLTLISGQIGLNEHDSRREREKLRQAIHYRALNENVQAHSEMSERVIDLLRYNHDAGNTLSTVFLNAQLLEEQVRRVQDAAPQTSALEPSVKRLLEQLERLKSLINRAHQVAEAPVIEGVPMDPVLQSTFEECRALYPATRIDLARVPPVIVRVQDGELGLRRILENVLYNACEGNGSEWALHVRIEVLADADCVRIKFTDDGPGFSAEQLDLPLVPFRTTKQKGSGLGLFNVSHLLQASGGSLHRRNVGERGACVEIELVRAVEDQELDMDYEPISEPEESGERNRGLREEPRARAGGDWGGT